MSPSTALAMSSGPAAPKAAQKLSGDVFATMINLSGRRRFTSQRVVLYALLAIRKDAGAAAIASDALTLFRDAHTALIQGNDSLPGVFCPALQEAYFGTEQGDRKIRDFIALADRVLHAIESGWQRMLPVLLDELIESTTPLLATLNLITALYETEARNHAQKVQNQVLEVMGEIKGISKHAHMVAFNAQIVAARAGSAGREFSVVANVLTHITGEIDQLLQAALARSSA